MYCLTGNMFLFPEGSQIIYKTLITQMSQTYSILSHFTFCGCLLKWMCSLY